MPNFCASTFKVEILRLLRDGWRPRVKRSKGYEYVSLRRSRAEKEIPLGRKTETLWRRVQENRPEGEVARLTLKVSAREQRMCQLRSELDAFTALKAQSRPATEMAAHCRHIVARSGERFCNGMVWPRKPQKLKVSA